MNVASENGDEPEAFRPRLDGTGDLETHIALFQDPQKDLQFEEQLLHDHAPHEIRLFIYRWRGPVLVMGRGQDLADVDETVCAAEHIPILRRRTGGTAVLHNGTINIALILPSTHTWARSIGGLYARFISHVSKALQNCEIPALPLGPENHAGPSRCPICFEGDSGETLLLNQRKVFGCAQHRLRNSVLVHGTLLLGLDIPQHSRVFKVPSDRIEQALAAVPDGHDPEIIVNNLIQEMATGLQLTPVQRGARYGGH